MTEFLFDMHQKIDGNKVKRIFLSFCLVFFLSASEAFCLSGQEKSLFEAIKQNNLTDLVSLIKAGVDVNIEDDTYKMPPLMYAVDKGNKELVEVLISAGADVKAETYFGATVLGRAVVYRPNKEIIELLISNGADINKKDW